MNDPKWWYEQKPDPHLTAQMQIQKNTQKIQENTRENADSAYSGAESLGEIKSQVEELRKSSLTSERLQRWTLAVSSASAILALISLLLQLIR